MRGFSAFSSAFARWGVVFGAAAAGAAFFSAVGRFVYGGPGSGFCDFGFYSSVLVAFLDVLGLALLFTCVT